MITLVKLILLAPPFELTELAPPPEPEQIGPACIDSVQTFTPGFHSVQQFRPGPQQTQVFAPGFQQVQVRCHQ